MKRELSTSIAVLFAGVLFAAETYTWNAGDGDWETPGNWILSTGEAASESPGASDDVVLATPQGATNTVTVTSTVSIGSLTLGGGGGDGRMVLSFKNGLSTNEVSGAVLVKAGGYMTHYGPSDNLYHLNLKVGGDMTIEEGGYVDTHGKGFGGNRGITSAGVVGSGGSKGCHGGRGQNKSYCYGNIRNPVYPGMSGVSRGSPYNELGFGRGGGVIYLEVAGNLVVDGEISSDAGGEYDQSQAGGSVLLRCASLTGSGRIAANPTRASAGGGRMAIYQTEAGSLEFSGIIGVSGGSDFSRSYRFYYPWLTGTYVPNTSYYAGSAGAGTIYVENAGDLPGRGTLIIKGCKSNNTIQSYTTDISELVDDSQEPFGAVIVTNGAYVRVSSGCTLKVISNLDTRGGRLITEDATAGVEFVGEGEATYFGSNTLYNFKCTVPGKAIRFGAPDALSKLVIPAGGKLTLTGDEDGLVSLLPSDPAEKWHLNVNADADSDVSFIAISNCNASAGRAILAIDSSNLGGNDYWSFSGRIIPGETNTWTGAESTDWANGANWSLSRPVEPTDAVIVPADVQESPVIPSGDYVCNAIAVESGAFLTLSGGCRVTVTNNFDCTGSLVFSDKEKLVLSSKADFSGSTVVPALGRVYIEGDGEQVVDLGGQDFYKLLVKRGGGSLALKGGFSAHVFRCLATNAVQSIVFDAGCEYAADEIYLNGLVRDEKRLSLLSSSPGSAWYLRLGGDLQCLTGVSVCDCNASGGALVVAGASSDNAGNNSNFDFTTVTANWCGGLTNGFAVAENWAPARLPQAGSKVTVFCEEDEKMLITLDAGNPVEAGILLVSGTDGSEVTLVANSAISTTGDLTVHTNATVHFNAFSDHASAPNRIGGDLRLLSGGTISHSGPASTENAKVHLLVAGDMTVEEGAAIDLTGKGYAVRTGPGWFTGNIDGTTRQGACHGGVGTVYIDHRVPCYGSMFAPFRWGSGSVSHTNTSPATHGYGGGGVKLTVGGTLYIFGGIFADGTREYDTAPTGGSIFIDVGVLAGNGSISAAAGTVESASANRRGGGGRIAIYQRELPELSQFSGTISTCNGLRGGAGTYFFSGSEAEDMGSELYFVKDVSPSYVTQFPMTNDYVDVAGQVSALRMLRRAYADVNMTISNAIVSVTNVSAEELWNLGSTIRVRDLDLKTSNSKIILNGCRIEVLSGEHKNGRGWYDGSYEAATNAGHVVLGEANGVPGEIVWVSPGLTLTIR